MKKYILSTLGFIIVFSFQSIAQRKDQKVLIAKNYERIAYAQHVPTKSVVVAAQDNRLSSPVAKNQQPMEHDTAAPAVMVTKRGKLSSPQAKNARPGQQTVKTYPMEFADQKTLKGPKAKNRHHANPKSNPAYRVAYSR